MNPVIDLMKSHSSVRRFKEEDIKEEDLRAILTAGQMASSWKNFQSYSIILVRSQERKRRSINSSLRKLFVNALFSYCL